eukprot:TRINITY_DN2289_c0_g1_i4.p1 TRINITY_DN2289_c0_g1~~TRINITY_DN2289_c0_g1_i4.p1  ORF type:complete len:124 (+),score=4.34 TRINITY_DN2289_c0_g1_i4:43-372(+)
MSETDMSTASNPTSGSSISTALSPEESNRKLFVGGLSWETSDADLRAHFETYGTVAEAVVMRDRMTQRSRGFGFVVFENEESTNAAAAVENQELGGRTVCSLAEYIGVA